MQSSVRIIEYLCHACGQHAFDVRAGGDGRRQWVCPCGVRWTGNYILEPYEMQSIEDRHPNPVTLRREEYLSPTIRK
jgi:hypothetical protein